MDADAVPLIQALLDAGSDPNESLAYGQTLLMSAATSSRSDAADRVNVLLKSGAAVNATDENTRTALFYAVDRNDASPEMVDALVRAGADVNRADTRLGQTVLITAIEKDPKPAVISSLLAAKADVNVRNIVGMTALMEASSVRAGSWLIPLLLRAGADAKTMDAGNHSALDRARKNSALKGTEALDMLTAASR